eukprot:2309250-Pyramimonas_sp.AAC.1
MSMHVDAQYCSGKSGRAAMWHARCAHECAMQPNVVYEHANQTHGLACRRCMCIPHLCWH